MPLPRAVLPTASVLAIAAAAAAAAGTFDYVRHFEVPVKGSGVWTGKFAPNPGEGELVGLSLEADWWDGPGDPRAGDLKKAPVAGIVYEVKRGDGPFVPLPAAARDLRLVARAAAPADAKGLLGGSAAGEWTVRQTAGGAYPHSVRLEFTCRGDPLLVKDLRVKSLMLPGLDPKPVVGHEYIPDRIDNPTLKGGAEIHAVIVVENCGARRTKEVDLDLVGVARGKRTGGKRIGFAQVPALEPGATAELKIDGKIPEDLATVTGPQDILAIVNPRAAEKEVEAWNNAAVRAFIFELPEKKEGAGAGDLRDR